MAAAQRASARKPATKVVPADKKNLPVSLADQIAKEVQEVAERVSSPSGDSIRITQDKKFAFPDGTEHPGPLDLVVLDFAYGNNFFDRPFKKGENIPPACFSRGMSQKDLVPSGNSPDKQAESCAKCPLNEWGSNGKGKACANNAYLAVIAADETDEERVLTLKVSPTAVRGWDNYVHTVRNKCKTVPVGVITQVYFDPNEDYASLRFGNPVPNPNLEQHFALRAAARERLLAEPDTSAYEAPAAVKGRGKRSR